LPVSVTLGAGPMNFEGPVARAVDCKWRAKKAQVLLNESSACYGR
jgi:hypothetical protein